MFWPHLQRRAVAEGTLKLQSDLTFDDAQGRCGRWRTSSNIAEITDDALGLSSMIDIGACYGKERAAAENAAKGPNVLWVDDMSIFRVS